MKGTLCYNSLCHKNLDLLLDTMENSNLARRNRSPSSEMETFLKLLLMVSTRHLMAREGPDQLVLIPTNLIWVSSFLQSIIKQNGIQIPIPHSGKV